MRIAVTGATGFIGRRVIAALCQHQGIDVLALSRTTPVQEDALRDRVTHLTMDLATPPCDAYERMGCPDLLIHLAWDGLSNYKSLHHFEHELRRQYDFLAQLVRGGLPSLVCTGTCFEYGMQSGALREDFPAQPSNPYGYAKDALRRQLQFLQATHPFAFCWARLFYTYGEGQAASSLYAQLRQAVERGDECFPMSGGEQLRDYLPVETLAQHLVHLAMHAPDAGIVNVCSGQAIAVRSLVEQWIRNHGWNMQLQLGIYPYPDYEPIAFWGDNHYLRSLLDGHEKRP